MLRPAGGDPTQVGDLAAYLKRISPDAAAPLDYGPLIVARKTAIDRPTGGDARRGAVLTERFCGRCHGEGAMRPPLELGLYEPDYLVSRVRWIAPHDARQMPPFPLDRLRDAELRDIVTYLVGPRAGPHLPPRAPAGFPPRAPPSPRGIPGGRRSRIRGGRRESPRDRRRPPGTQRALLVRERAEVQEVPPPGRRRWRLPVPAPRRVRPGTDLRRAPGAGRDSPPRLRAELASRGPGVPGDPRTRIERMRRACTAAADVLREVGAAVQPGVTTDALDAIAHAGYLARGGYPSTLGYRGFRKSMCTSVNEVVVHGIPDDRPLEAGDIVNCDVTIYLEGMHGDCSATFAVGEIDEAAKKLLRVTEEALFKGIEAVRPGRQIREIGRAIAAHADAAGFGVVRNYCGHGIGEIFHTDLQIPHFDDPTRHHSHRGGDDLHHRAHAHRGQLGGEALGRRVDGGHRRREALGPDGAHGARRRRAARRSSPCPPAS